MPRKQLTVQKERQRQVGTGLCDSIQGLFGFISFIVGGQENVLGEQMEQQEDPVIADGETDQRIDGN